MSNGKVRVMHLLRKHNKSRRPASWRKDPITCTKEEAIAELAGFEKQIRPVLEQDPQKGVDLMAALCKENSDCSSGPQAGGDLGEFGPGEMQAAFEKASFALQVGELSTMVDTDSGVHIIVRLS